MAKMKLGLVGTALLFTWGALYAAEPAGKILVLQGTASATRAGKDVKLERGSTVESGDIVRVGDTSSLQIRFTDESVVALRANTVFNIENYRFAPQEKTGSSLFGLIKGGMRTITGLIGKSNPDSYAVKANTATIGIRGTHFTAVSCAGDCFNADGSKSEDGLFGSVTDGRIVVRNNAGESEFGRDQFFVVRSVDTSPQPLVSPPAFLRDKLDGQARAKGKLQATGSPSPASNAEGQQPSATTSSAPATTTGQTILAADSTTANPLQTLTGTTYVAASAPVVQQTAAAPTMNWSWAMAWTENFTWSGPYGSGSATGADGWAEQVSLSSAPDKDVAEAMVAANFASPVDFLTQAASGSWSGSYSDYYSGQTVTYTETFAKSASTEVGFSAEAGNVSWGRYSETGTFSSSDGYSDSWQGIQHWAIGDPVTAMPTAGTFTYVPAGGTSPTDGNGNVGTMSTHGRWTVDFGSKTIQTTVPIAWSMPTGTSYSVSVPLQNFTVSTQAITNEMGAAVGTYTTIANPSLGYGLQNTTTCTGCVSAMSNVSVTAFGAQAQGLGAAVTTNATLPASATQNMGSVQVYRR